MFILNVIQQKILDNYLTECTRIINHNYDLEKCKTSGTFKFFYRMEYGRDWSKAKKMSMPVATDEIKRLMISLMGITREEFEQFFGDQ